MQGLKLAGAIALMALLAGCATPNLEKLKQTTATAGTPFTQALTEGYKAEATEELNEELTGEHAEVFAAKGLKAADGAVVLPEEVPNSAWGAPLRSASDLTAARAELVGLLDKGARSIDPQTAATAQVKFDCWVEEAAEPGQEKDEADCKAAFADALAKLKVLKYGTVPAPTGGSQYQVYFDFNKSVLTADSRKIIAAAAAAAKGKDAHIVLVGKADLVGSDKYNLALSQRRAEAVVQEFVHAGVARSAIEASGVGLREPPVPTPPGVREARNRVVEIAIK